MKLLDWIDVNKLKWDWLSYNLNAIDLLSATEEKYDDIDFYELSQNPNLDKFIEMTKGKIIIDYDWDGLSMNPSNFAFELLKENKSNINWRELSKNRNSRAIELFDNLDDIDWQQLSRNPADWVINLLNANKDKIYWPYLSQNPAKGAIELLKDNPENIYWGRFSRNESDEAIEMLINNPDKISLMYLPLSNAIDIIKKNIDNIITDYHKMEFLSCNRNAIDILKAHQDKICWDSFSENSAIFEIDYKKWDKLMTHFMITYIL